MPTGNLPTAPDSATGVVLPSAPDGTPRVAVTVRIRRDGRGVVLAYPCPWCARTHEHGAGHQLAAELHVVSHCSRQPAPARGLYLVTTRGAA